MQPLFRSGGLKFVRWGRPLVCHADLHVPIEECHISCAMMHVANASYRLGRTLNCNPETQEVIGDDEANRLLREEARGYRQPFDIPENI
jgi:hypothetical protein